MKQFGKIFQFELKGYMKNRTFIGITMFLVVAIVVCMFFPNIRQALQKDDGGTDTAERPVMLIYAGDETLAALVKQYFDETFPDYNVTVTNLDIAEIEKQITSGEAQCAFVMENACRYTYYVDNLSMYDTNTALANTVLQEVYRYTAMLGGGLTQAEVEAIMSATVESNTVTLGKDQGQNFFYTYVMIFALYMVILLYGQMVTTNVATEKSSRAMELLITSAKPANMMFGKVLASCLAGLVQLVAIFGTALVCYNLNKGAWGDNQIIASLFDFPLELLGYLLTFFVLGYLIYAFLYGAIGSTVSKLEDVNTAVMPVTFLFIIGFFVVMFSMTGGNVDSVLMKVCSYIPFTSPMAMFTRICMSRVAWYEIAVSVGILVGSTVTIGIAAAKIYRMGVLLYGNKLNIGSILKMTFKK